MPLKIIWQLKFKNNAAKFSHQIQETLLTTNWENQLTKSKKMNTLTKGAKEKVEKCLKENECAISVDWGEGSCTIINAEGKAIEDYLIDVEDDGAIYYTPVSNPSVTLQVA